MTKSIKWFEQWVKQSDAAYIVHGNTHVFLSLLVKYFPLNTAIVKYFQIKRLSIAE